MSVTVKASLGKEKYYTKVVAGENSIITDEPVDHGGQNKGFNPHEILATSLASCTVATLKMYMDRKEWFAESIDVEVVLEHYPQTGNAVFTRTIGFQGINLDEDQQKRLLLIAEKCPVHKLLTGNIEINTKM